MQFSIIFEAQLADPTVGHEHQLFHDCVEQAVLAEQMGFDRIWAVEHHCLKWYAHMSAPEVFLTWVAARTRTIRVGHGVVCMPFAFNHPARVAERAATLDLLSGGRLDLGAGRGGTAQETSLCGVDRDRTTQEVEEALRIIGRAWQGEQLSYHGELIDIPPHPILPRPHQMPHPPLFLACSRTETLRQAAELGVGALVMGFAGPEAVAELRTAYDAARTARTGDRLVSGRINDHFAGCSARPSSWPTASGPAPSACAASVSSPRPSRTGTAGRESPTRPWWTARTRRPNCGGPPRRSSPTSKSSASRSARTPPRRSGPTTPTGRPRTPSPTWSGSGRPAPTR